MSTLNFDEAELDALAQRVAERVLAGLPQRPVAGEVGPEWLSTKAAAAHLGVTAKTLETWRSAGKGPRANRAGTRSIRYARTDLDGWMRTQK